MRVMKDVIDFLLYALDLTKNTILNDGVNMTFFTKKCN